MARPIDKLSIELQFKDAGSQAVIEKLRGSLKRLEMSASGVRPNIKELRDQILSQGRASVKSVSNINAQLAALKALRDEAKIGGKTFKQLTADISKFEKQLGKTQARRQGGGGAALRATQTAGAVISGGIFGGPEGAIGGLLGAPFGVGGAFAGAAIGGQLGGIRQSLSASADYASQIQKLQIALRGVAGSQENYNSALETAAQVTRTLNVPQQEAVRGVTRLTAAVTGAGGPIRDAETTFKNVTAAIKATGGSSEDVQGAITAMVQVFSKGKLSAEELSGQLAERLPGAVTMFAKANDMTLPELQKNLKAGTVGLNELMSFIEELGVKYSGTALEIASSNAEAGARLTVAFDDMKAKVGDALLDTGSEFQNTFGKFIQDITPAMVKAAQVISGAMSVLAKNLKPVLAGLATFVSIITGAALVSIVTNLAAGLGLFGVAAQGAATGIGALTASMAINPLFGGALAVSGIVAGIVAITDALGKQKRELQEIARLSSNQTYASLSNIERQEKISATTSLRAAARAELADIKQNKLYEGQTEETAPIKIAIRMKELRKQIAEFDKDLERLTNPVKKKDDKPFDYKPPTTDNDSDTASAKDITEEQADALIDQINLRRKDVQLTKEAIRNAAESARVAAQALLPQRRRVELAKINQREANQINQLNQEQLRLEKEKLRVANNVSKAKLELNKLLTKAKGEQGILNDKQLQQELNQIKVNELMLKFNILVEEGVYNHDELKEKIEAAVAAMNQAQNPIETFRDGLRKIFDEAINIEQALAQRGVEAVQQFGDAFANFVATGKANFKEFAASLLQDLARIFAKFALFKSLSLIPGVGNFLGFKNGGVVGASAPAPDPLTQPGVMLAANGAVMARNRIVPYAKGGIVKKPTFFQYANGGSGRFGLMGEAGPEAIMPLRRGANGKLGVEASGGGVGNVVVNVDASGTQVQGNQANANQLGKAIGAAVQAELIKQRRPGGLLTR